MRNLTLAVLAWLGGLCVAEAASPQQLLGKSVVVSWSETRQQREQTTPGGGWTEFHSVSASHKLNIYVSTAGRMFSRQVNSISGLGSGKSDQVAGEGGATRAPVFNGQTMTVIGVARGGARRIEINFDSGFTSCTARASMGFEAGKTRIAVSPITKQNVEIRSDEAGAASCAVQNGNVLGGPS